SPANESIPSSCVANSALKSGTCMRIYTQTNVSGATGDPSRCVQWQTLLDSTGQTYLLRTRNWDPDWLTSGDVSAWRTVATGMVVSGLNASGTPITGA